MANHLFFNQTETPCIGICSTIYGDQVCRGCFRSCQEVIDWNRYADAQKQDILASLNQQIVTVLQTKIEISDAALLKHKCLQFKVKIRPTWDPLTWAHALLREGIDRIQDITKYGIKIKATYAKLRLPQLLELIDTEIFDAAHRSI